jgi:hypothetical protein
MDTISMLVGLFAGVMVTAIFVLLNRSGSNKDQLLSSQDKRPTQESTPEFELELNEWSKMIQHNQVISHKAIIQQQEFIKNLTRIKTQPEKNVNAPVERPSEEDDFQICWDLYPED